MTFSASYDGTTKIVTALTAVALGGIMFATHNRFVDWVAPTVIILGYAFSPQRYDIVGRTIVIHRLIADVRVPLDALREVRRAGPEDLRGAIRLWGSGGLFGYYGLFRTSKLGKCRWFVTNRRNLVVVVTDSKTTLYSPDAVDEFIAGVRG